MRTFLRGLLILISGGSLAAEEARDVIFATYGERELQLDWFRPDNETICPGILVVHGGGWVGGTRKSFERIAKDLASEGYVVANLEYRLATETKFPGAVLDVKAAIRWMRAHAKELRLDPDRIGAVGGSAGGHLVAMTASTPDHEHFSKTGNHPDESDALQAAVIMGAGVDQVARVKEVKSGSIKNCVIFFGGEYDEVPGVYAQGSPITHISEMTSPILMIDGELDKPGQRYGDYRKRLDEAGVLNAFVIVPGAKHGEWGKAKFRPTFVEAMVEFLGASLANE